MHGLDLSPKKKKKKSAAAARLTLSVVDIARVGCAIRVTVSGTTEGGDKLDRVYEGNMTSVTIAKINK